MTEFRVKQERIRALLEAHQLDALLIQRVSNFAWATCGAASYVNTATTFGASSLLILRDGHHLIANNIEAPRLEKEEKLNYQGWEFHITPWYQAQQTVTQLTRDLKLGADLPYPGAVDLTNEMAHLRAELTAEEGVRLRVLGRLCAEALNNAARAIRPGQTEHQIAARLAYEAQTRGVQAVVNLIATDERVHQYRHPLPTFKTLERYAMLVLCGRRWGLICSLTRLVHIGPLPDEIRRKAEAVAYVDAALISATRPGATLGQVFQRGIEAYEATGFGEEWQLHHQGGPAGYEPREYLVRPDSSEIVAVGQTFAWNPSITGVKSEDTVQVGENENEVITHIAGWPVTTIKMAGQSIQRPAILELH